MRLDAILQSWMRRRGLDRTSLKASQQLVQRGEVEVDGAVITDPKYQVVCGLETVSIAAGVAGAGEPSGSSSARGGTCERVVVETEEQPLYVMNKPTGATSQQRPGLPRTPNTHHPRHERAEGALRALLDGNVRASRPTRRHPREPSVYDLVPESLRRDGLVAFGRLDVDTTGALLFGTDGGLQTLLTMPTGGVWKVYEAELAQPCHLDPRAAELFAAGLTLPDGCVCESARLTIVEPGLADARVRVRVSLHEGMYHQVKRMLAAVGGTVAKLHRETFGPIGVAGLAPGEMRRLSESELRALLSVLPPDRSTALAPQMEKACKRRRAERAGDKNSVVV